MPTSDSGDDAVVFSRPPRNDLQPRIVLAILGKQDVGFGWVVEKVDEGQFLDFGQRPIVIERADLALADQHFADVGLPAQLVGDGAAEIRR